MTDYTFGSVDVTVSYTDAWVQSTISIPNGRTMANGADGIIVTHLLAYARGRGASRTCTLSLDPTSGSTASGSITVSSASAATSTGWVNVTDRYMAASTGAFRITCNGSFYFGRDNASTGSVDNYGTARGVIYGGVRYVRAPAAPTDLTATASTVLAGTINLAWTAPDSGGSAITQYTIYRDGVLLVDTGSTATTYSDTTATPGVSYTYEVGARNAVTDSAGTTSVLSTSDSATAYGDPSAPQSLTATASTTVTGRISLSWSAPATTGIGGITGYNIFRGGTQIATTTGTGTTYVNNGLTPYTNYSYTVKARNAFSDSNGSLSPASNSANDTAGGPPGAPTGLSATADALVPGKIDLSWTAPAVTGGGITGYNVRFDSGTLITATSGTGTTYSVTGLNPGQSYSFNVYARNALADAEGSQSVASNTASATALGEPGAPTSVSATASTTIPNRITLSWTAPAGTMTGYNIFEYNTTTLASTLIATTQATSYKIDGLTAGVSKSYFIRARNSYTDTLGTGYPGNYGGTASSTVSATPNSDYSRSAGSVVAITNDTNTTFNGTFTINAITPTTVRYSKTASNIPSTVVVSGTITDNTNVTLNGTYTIATPTANTFSYAKTASNIATSSAVGGTVTNNTNASFNGTKTITAVNSGAKTISYALVAGDIASVAVPVNAAPGAFGTVSNTTNAVYNGTGYTITGVTTYTISYSKTNANISETNAAGTVTDTTNRDSYNGSQVITGTPTYNTFTFATAGADQASTDIVASEVNEAERVNSPAELDIRYRSGWAG